MKRFRGKRKLFNKNMKMPAVLNNKIVLYIVLVVAIVYVLANISHNRFDEVGIFVLVAILSTYFSKNMIINLTIALVVSVIYGQSKNVMEGFKEGEKSKKDAVEEDDDEEEEEKDDDETKSEIPKKDNKLCYKKKTDDKGKHTWEASETLEKDCLVENNMCWGTLDKCKKRDGFGQRQVPSSQPAKVDGGDDDAPGKRIDNESTMELAYNNLQSMLGKKGIQNLTSETKRLVKQQEGLVDTIKELTPILQSAKDVMNSLGGDKLNMKDMSKTLSGLLPK